MVRQRGYLILGALLGFCTLAHAEPLVPPPTDSALYYRLGGEQSFRAPPTSYLPSLPLRAGAQWGAGYSCGEFNPAVALTESVNRLRSQLTNAKQAVIQNATSAIGHLPMYWLAEANPTLYNIVNNALIEANEHIQLATKTCQQMQHETDAGDNPYQQWARVSLSRDWQREIKKARASGHSDITQAERTIAKQQGQSGAPWITGTPDPLTGQPLAGGLNQPPVYVLADTTRAGYNVLLGRDPNDARPANDPTSELATAWPTPQQAADWVVEVLGDLKITTCQAPHCAPGARPGKGLSYQALQCQDHQPCVQTLIERLQALVDQSTPITQATLLAVSAPGMVINTEVIDVLRQLDPIHQTLYIQKLAQEIAVHIVLEKALLARQVLLAGLQLPDIHHNPAAATFIQTSLQRLQEDMETLVFEHALRHQLANHTVTQLISEPTREPPPPSDGEPPAPTLFQGAVRKETF